MTTGGWITMVLSLAAVWTTAFWAFRKVLKTAPASREPASDGEVSAS